MNWWLLLKVKACDHLHQSSAGSLGFRVIWGLDDELLSLTVLSVFLG